MGARRVFALYGTIALEGIGNLNKNLTAAQKEFNKATREVEIFGKHMVKAGTSLTKTFTAPIVGLTGAMVLLANKTGQYADNLLDLNQITGLSTDNLQGLEGVARNAGVEFDGLVGIVSKFTSKLPQIISEGGEASKAMKALGVNVHDSQGNMRDMNEMLPEMINKLQGVENVTERNVLAQQIFGKDLKALAPVLGMTSEEFNKLYNGAKGATGYMSKEAIQAAADYKVEMDKLKQEFTGVWRELTVKFIPILKDTLIPMVRDTIVPALRKFGDMLGAIAQWFQGLPEPVRKTVVVFAAIVAAIGPILIVGGKMLILLKGIIPVMGLLFKAVVAVNAAMMANPVLLIITGIGLLIIAIVNLVRHWDWVKETSVKVWDSIVYATQQGVSYAIELFLKYVSMYVEGLGLILKHIPGLNKAYQFASDGIAGLIEKQHELREARKAERDEAKAQAAAMGEVALQTDKVTTATVLNTAATAEQAEAAKKAAEAAKKLAEERAQIEAQWSDKLMRETANRMDLLDYEFNEAVRIAMEKGAATADIEEYYALKRQEIWDEEEARGNERRDRELRAETLATEQKAANFFSYAEDFAKGAANLGEATKNLVVKIIGAIQQEISARATASIAIAWAQAGATFGASLSQIGVTMSKTLPAIGALEGLKGIVRGLATGGLVKSGTGGGVFQVGEGSQDEIVMPLRTGVSMFLDELGARLGTFGGAQAALALPSGGAMGVTAGGGSGGSLRPVELHIGTLVADDRGLKMLERKLEQVRIGESQRRGGV